MSGFELNVDIADLQKKKVMIATPMYGGMCTGAYTNSSIDLGRLTTKYELPYKFSFLYNESLITRARNYLADEFMRSDCTHLMFIDADIGFDPNDVVFLSALAAEDSDKDIVCGPYPKKCISWEKVKRAVDKGFGDEDAEQLQNFIGDYVFNPAEGVSEIKIDEPVEVLEGGTGFMMIQKRVFQKFDECYPHLRYRPDHARTEHWDGSREITAYFDALIDDKNTNVVSELEAFYKANPNATPEQVIAFMKDKENGLTRPYSNRYLSEDYMFCQYVRRMGMKVWFCPWMRMSHTGTYIYAGSLADLAAVGVAATVDVDAIGKRKKLKGKIPIDNHKMVK